MHLVLIISALVLGSGAAMAAAPTLNHFPASQSAYNPTTSSTAAQSTARKWRRAISDIREDALRLQTADGGSLTPSHRASLQQRLEVANQRLIASSAAGCGGTRINCDLASGQRPSS